MTEIIDEIKVLNTSGDFSPVSALSPTSPVESEATLETDNEKDRPDLAVTAKVERLKVILVVKQNKNHPSEQEIDQAMFVWCMSYRATKEDRAAAKKILDGAVPDFDTEGRRIVNAILRAEVGTDKEIQRNKPIARKIRRLHSATVDHIKSVHQEKEETRKRRIGFNEYVSNGARENLLYSQEVSESLIGSRKKVLTSKQNRDLATGDKNLHRRANSLAGTQPLQPIVESPDSPSVEISDAHLSRTQKSPAPPDPSTPQTKTPITPQSVKGLDFDKRIGGRDLGRKSPRNASFYGVDPKARRAGLYGRSIRSAHMIGGTGKMTVALNELTLNAIKEEEQEPLSFAEEIASMVDMLPPEVVRAHQENKENREKYVFQFKRRDIGNVQSPSLDGHKLPARKFEYEQQENWRAGGTRKPEGKAWVPPQPKFIWPESAKVMKITKGPEDDNDGFQTVTKPRKKSFLSRRR